MLLSAAMAFAVSTGAPAPTQVAAEAQPPSSPPAAADAPASTPGPQAQAYPASPADQPTPSDIPPPPGTQPAPSTEAAIAHHAPGDPFEKQNRKFFNFNQNLDKRLVGPTARGYKHSFPEFLQLRLHNFVTNVGEPVVFFNDVLQLRPKRAMKTGFRFVVNSTVGIGGLFDPAVTAGAEHHDNDFGITLGRYGCPPGPYLYSPLLGPSTVRDSLGKAVDSLVLDPLNWIGYRKVIEHPPPPKHPYFHHENEIPRRDAIRLGVAILGGIDQRARVEEDLNAMMSTATDPYATLRSVYLQHRESEVDQARWRHKAVPDFETPADTTSPAAAATPSNQAPAEAQPAPVTDTANRAR